MVITTAGACITDGFVTDDSATTTFYLLEFAGLAGEGKGVDRGIV